MSLTLDLGNTYFNTNFKVASTSVAKLSEAEYIFLGDRHDCQEHQFKISQFINAIKKGVFFTEQCQQPGYVYSKSEHLFYQTLSPSIEIRGWDSATERKMMDTFCQDLNQAAHLMETCLNGNILPDKIGEVVQEIDFLVNKEFINNILDKTETIIKTSQYEETQKELDELEQFRKYIQLRQEIKEIILSGKDELRAYIAATAITGLIAKKLIDGYAFYQRNLFMIKVTEDKSIVKPCLLQAGKAHLDYQPNYDCTLIYKLSVDALKQYLHGKKYIILSPTKKPVDLTYKQKIEDLRNKLLNITKEHFELVSASCLAWASLGIQQLTNNVLLASPTMLCAAYFFKAGMQNEFQKKISAPYTPRTGAAADIAINRRLKELFERSSPN